MEGEAWVTLATNDEYSVGALVLAHSLKRCQTLRKIVVMVTSSISDHMRYVMYSITRDIFYQKRITFTNVTISLISLMLKQLSCSI